MPVAHDTTQETLWLSSLFIKRRSTGVTGSSLLTFEGLMGPAKALMDSTGSLGLPGYLGQALWGPSSVWSGDHGAPITGAEELSSALRRGT